MGYLNSVLAEGDAAEGECTITPGGDNAVQTRPGDTDERTLHGLGLALAHDPSLDRALGCMSDFIPNSGVDRNLSVACHMAIDRDRSAQRNGSIHRNQGMDGTSS